ncbi:co-chaperone GroES [Bombiscardovia coagulans]|uniref:Co-chaperonin GroES n=1 Tax=Bombiscardovia coagulans TaxID=686666 RepID=A0A261EU16_9BIFI|nr:co-chaperone GroES [Bombiscardovia coagulans]OZG50350.1 molecular chaperone GroES [Bombiscardovia coagulans]
MSISLTPLEDKVVIKQAPAETKTASGLVIPDTAKEKPQQGEVLAVGPGRRDDKGELIPVEIKVGDKVLYSKYGGTEVTYEGEDYLIVSARDVLAILK